MKKRPLAVVLISDGHTYEFSNEDDEKTTYIEKAKGIEFEALPTYGIYSETDGYAYAKGITYTIHGLEDDYYTGDYKDTDPDRYDGTERYYTTRAEYKNSNGAKICTFQMPYGTWAEYLKHITAAVKKDGYQYVVQLTYDDSGDYGDQCIGPGEDKNVRAAETNEILKAKPNNGPDEYGNYYIKCGLDASGNDNQLMHASGLDSMELTVGNGTSFKPMIDETDKNVAYFGAKDDKQDIGSSNYRFKVTYDPETEAFEWTFNKHITNFDRVQLTYTVKLAKRESAPGPTGSRPMAIPICIL